MKRFFFALSFAFLFSGCDVLQNLPTGVGGVTEAEAGQGIKEALSQGIAGAVGDGQVEAVQAEQAQAAVKGVGEGVVGQEGQAPPQQGADRLGAEALTRGTEGGAAGQAVSLPGRA